MKKIFFFPISISVCQKTAFFNVKISVILLSILTIASITKAQEPCGLQAPENFRVVVKSSTWLNLKWSVVPNAVKYLINVYDSNSKELIQNKLTINPEIEFDGLNNHSLYDFEIFSICQENILSSNSFLLSGVLTFAIDMKPQKPDISDGTSSATDEKCQISILNNFCNFQSMYSNFQKALIKYDQSSSFIEFCTLDGMPFNSSQKWTIKSALSETSIIKLENSVPNPGDYIMVNKNGIEIVKLFPIQLVDIDQCGINGQFINNQSSDLFIEYFQLTPQFERRKNEDNKLHPELLLEDSKILEQVYKLQIFNMVGQKVIDDNTFNNKINLSNYNLSFGLYFVVLNYPETIKSYKYFQN